MICQQGAGQSDETTGRWGGGGGRREPGRSTAYLRRTSTQVGKVEVMHRVKVKEDVSLCFFPLFFFEMKGKRIKFILPLCFAHTVLKKKSTVHVLMRIKFGFRTSGERSDGTRKNKKWN